MEEREEKGCGERSRYISALGEAEERKRGGHGRVIKTVLESGDWGVDISGCEDLDTFRHC